jgi:hypothetical protein
MEEGRKEERARHGEGGRKRPLAVERGCHT